MANALETVVFAVDTAKAELYLRCTRKPAVAVAAAAILSHIAGQLSQLTA